MPIHVMGLTDWRDRAGRRHVTDVPQVLKEGQTMTPTETYGSDDGRPCGRCGGTVYRYEIACCTDRIVQTWCVSCHETGTFLAARRVQTAAEPRDAARPR